MDQRPFTAASFEQFLSECKFMGSKCTQCGALWCPPRPICNKCGSNEMEWMEMGGKGTLIAFTTIEVGTTAMLDAGYDRNNPYCSGIVQLDEGPRISAQILGVDASDPETITIGTPLKVDFVERGTFALSKELAAVKKTYVAFRSIA